MHGKLFVLDSGAGFLGVSADIKRIFQDKVFVTALNMAYPLAKREQLIRAIEKHNKNANPAQKKAFFGPVLKNLEEMAERAKTIDEIRVGTTESFKPKIKYNIILDSFGPAYYSPHKTRLLEKYLTILEPGGSLIVVATLNRKIQGLKADEGLNADKLSAIAGKKSELAKKTGYYFKVTRHISGPRRTSEFVELKKVPVK